MKLGRFFLALSVVPFGLLAVLLAQPGEETRAHAFFYLPLAADSDDSKSVAAGTAPVGLELVGPTNDGQHKYRLRLQCSGGRELARALAIEIPVSTDARGAAIIKAQLSLYGAAESMGEVVFAAGPQPRFVDNQMLVLKRTGSEGKIQSAEKAELIISVEGQGDLSVWSHKLKNTEAPISLRVSGTKTDKPETISVIYGSYTPPSPAVSSRAHLLEFMWSGNASRMPWIVIGAILLASLLWVAGVVVFAASLAPERSGASTLALGVALLFSAICLVQAVIVPPFQAPDEPDHFLTFDRFFNEGQLFEESLRFANSGHFERIKRRTDEVFATVDTAKPMTSGWASSVHLTEKNRSPLANVFGGLFSKLADGRTVGEVLLASRLLVALFVSAIFGLALVVSSRVAQDKTMMLLFALLALMAPAISYFSTVFSNYPFLLGGFLIQGIAIILLWQSAGSPADQRAAIVSAVMAGLGTGIALCASVNGIISLVLWAVLIPPFLGVASPAGRSLRFPAHCVVSFSVSLLVTCSLVWIAGGGAPFLPGPLIEELQRQVSGGVSDTVLPWVFLAGYIFLLLLLVAVVVFAGRLEKFSLPRSNAWLFAYAAVLAVFVSVLLWLPPTKLPDIMANASDSGVSRSAYTGSVVFNFLDGLLPGEADWYVVDSFWGVLGWLDTPLPAPLILFLRLGLGLGLLLFCITVLFPASRAIPPTVVSFFCLTGVIATAAAVGALYHTAVYNVHGRYLLGPYAFALALAACGYGALMVRLSLASRFAVLASGVLLTSLIQLTVWSTLLDRYF